MAKRKDAPRTLDELDVAMTLFGLVMLALVVFGVHS
jgi:hypothetical protein